MTEALPPVDLQQHIPPKEKVLLELVDVVRIDPENPEHVEAAHRLDEESAIQDGMLNQDEQPETLSEQAFDDWVHSRKEWHSLYLGSIREHPFSMFGNTYDEGTGRRNALIKGGFIKSEDRGEELATFVPEVLEKDWTLSQQLTARIVRDRFNEHPELDYIVEYVSHDETSNQINQGEARSLTDLGFTQAGTRKYARGEKMDSTAYIIRRGNLVSFPETV